MNIGQKIMEGIINSNLLKAECGDNPDHRCITTWMSGAAEQIEALAQQEWVDALTADWINREAALREKGRNATEYDMHERRFFNAQAALMEGLRAEVESASAASNP